MRPEPPAITPWPRSLGWALLSGTLLGCAFPPVDAKWLGWVGLVPLLVLAMRGGPPRRLFVFGYLAGVAFFLICLYPLVSASAWTGWARVSQQALAAHLSRQAVFLHLVWLLFALWCGFFWGFWMLGLQRFGTRPWRLTAAAAALWVLVPEWLRAQTVFGYSWGFLGNLLADTAPLRQLAAVGGVSLLSAMVVAVNVALAQAVGPRPARGAWRAPGAVLLIAAACWAWGWSRLAQRPSGPAIQAAAVQLSRPRYLAQEFLPIGLDRAYVPAIEQALQQRASLIVLPESIALGGILLDETRSTMKPPDRQIPRVAWDAVLAPMLAGTPSVVVIGMDTVEEGRDHNTMVAWTAAGHLGHYHKQRLVPFAEYRPRGWGAWVSRGESQYQPGQGSQLIEAGGQRLGSFICQEVLMPSVARRSARDGATVLVSGGNDGVFAHPAVARVHADVAQLRATETGRYLVRAMKTGVSALIDPWGRELAAAPVASNRLLVGAVRARTDRTVYVRLGDWMVWASALLLLVFEGARRR
jgi:apolipoprotein N-acyltransferase